MSLGQRELITEKFSPVCNPDTMLSFFLSGPNDCEFSFDFCGLWVDKSTSTYKWIRHKGKTPSSRTGPEGDHTNRMYNHFLFICLRIPINSKGEVANSEDCTKVLFLLILYKKHATLNDYSYGWLQGFLVVFLLLVPHDCQ